MIRNEPKGIMRRWWYDETYKRELIAKVESKDWRIAMQKSIPAQVIKIVYAGYKIKLPDETEMIVNPDTVSFETVSYHDYAMMAKPWMEEQEKLNSKKLVENALQSEMKRSLELFQSNCLHCVTSNVEVMRTSGCDIDDTQCNVCQKVLRRSWSTYSDKDPDDHVSDWEWWCREHQRLYNQVPLLANYKIVEKIE